MWVVEEVEEGAHESMQHGALPTGAASSAHYANQQRGWLLVRITCRRSGTLKQHHEQVVLRWLAASVSRRGVRHPPALQKEG